MKKITFLFFIAACASSMNYGMNMTTNSNEQDEMLETNSTRDSSMLETMLDTNLQQTKKYVAEKYSKQFAETKNINSNEKITNTQIQLPKGLGTVSFFINFGIGAITEYCKVSNKLRAAILLASNVSYAFWRNKEYRTCGEGKYGKKKIVSPSLSLHITDGIFGAIGGLSGTGLTRIITNKIVAFKKFSHIGF